MSEFYVYEHTRNDTNAIFYVGKGRDRRAWAVKKRTNKHWHNIVSKHGHEVRIVASGIDEELAFFAEQERIDQLTRLGVSLVNRTKGGDGVSLVGEAKEKHKRSINTPENRAKKSANGKKVMLDPEFQARMRQAYLDPVLAEKRLSALRNAVRKPDALERRRAQLASIRSPEQIAAAQARSCEVRKRPVVCVTTEQEFDSVISAACWLQSAGHAKAAHANITAVCRGRRSVAYGYTWRYK